MVFNELFFRYVLWRYPVEPGNVNFQLLFNVIIVGT
jgi:hypothetical protein